MNESHSLLFKKRYRDSYSYFSLLRFGLMFCLWISGIMFLIPLILAILGCFWGNSLTVMSYLLIEGTSLKFVLLAIAYSVAMCYLNLYIIPNISHGHGMFMALHGEFKSSLARSNFKTSGIADDECLRLLRHYDLAHQLSFNARWFNLLWFADVKNFEHQTLEKYPESHFKQ